MALNSLEFLATALTAALLLPVLRHGWRVGLFLALNLLFAFSYWGVQALPIGLGYVLSGYVLAKFVKGRGTVALVFSLGFLVAPLILLRGGPQESEAGRLTFSTLVSFAGLSFLFFKMAHVVIDSAGGAIERLPFDRYLNYSLNFTTLLLGPIQRYQDFDAQWEGRTPPLPEDIEPRLDAVNRTLRGLVKAFALAPWLAPYILHAGLPFEQMAPSELLLRCYAFYLFLYLDFSGYCDVVIGVGTLMGIRPPENFNFPFASRNVSAYWLRVHRSLTLWLTDYVFTPVYRFGIRHGTGRFAFATLAVSILVTMLVAGAWHGATLNFVLFGLVHGIALVIMRGYDMLMVRWMGMARFRQFSAAPVVTGLAVLVTFNFTALAYLFFALDGQDSVRVLARFTEAVL